MCDELTERDNDDYLRKRGITRRDFNKLGMGAALAMLLLPVTA
jgi:carboxymethylenebutenolidase